MGWWVGKAKDVIEKNKIGWLDGKEGRKRKSIMIVLEGKMGRSKRVLFVHVLCCNVLSLLCGLYFGVGVLHVFFGCIAIRGFFFRFCPFAHTRLGRSIYIYICV